MEELYSLMHTLTSSEWSSLKVFLTAFSPHNPDSNKLHRLACILIEAKRPPSSEYCIKKIYGEGKGGGFAMLKSRLEDKTLDFLLTDITNAKQKELDDNHLAYIKVTKMLGVTRLLRFGKPRTKLVYKLLDEIISISKEYEFYSMCAAALKEKKASWSWKVSKTHIDKIGGEIEKYLFMDKLLTEVIHYFISLFAFYEFQPSPDRRKIMSFLRSTIPKAKKAYHLTRSREIKYRMKYLELEYAQSHHGRAKQICLEILRLIRASKAVYTRNRMGIAYDNLSRCELLLGNLRSAAKFAREAQKKFIPKSENYAIALEQEFYALFAMQDYERAAILSFRMLTHADRQELGEFRFAKYNFFSACVLFKQKKYNESLHILSQPLGIDRSKAGWEIGVRFLRIMIFVEQNRTEDVGIEIERLRKFSSYNRRKTTLRDKTILKLLARGRRSNFMCHPKDPRISSLLFLLKSNKQKYRWEPFTHEVIPLHEWLIEKIQRKI